MAFHLEIQRRDRYLYFVVSGDLTEESLIDLGHRIRQLCSEHEVLSVLLDCKNMQGALSRGDLYFASQKYTEAVGTEIRVAYINPPAAWSSSDDEFGRTMVHSRGGALELFASEEAAENWLVRSK